MDNGETLVGLEVSSPLRDQLCTRIAVSRDLSIPFGVQEGTGLLTLVSNSPFVLQELKENLIQDDEHMPQQMKRSASSSSSSGGGGKSSGDAMEVEDEEGAKVDGAMLREKRREMFQAAR